jgi:hypothetical protein
MHEETTESIQNAAQVIKGAAQVDVGNVDMPVLMGLQRLPKPVPLRDGLLFHRDNNPACFNTRQILADIRIQVVRPPTRSWDFSFRRAPGQFFTFSAPLPTLGPAMEGSFDGAVSYPAPGLTPCRLVRKLRLVFL